MGESFPPAAIAKASAHPLRTKILDLFDGEPRSPSAIAAELNAPLPNVAYHVRVLRELGAIKLVDTQLRRGAVEHFYVVVWQPAVAAKQVMQ